MLNNLKRLFGQSAAEENPNLATYQEYRKVGMALNEKLVKFGMDNAALSAASRALGMKGAGRQLLLDHEGDISVLADYVVYEYRREGQNTVTRYQAAIGGANPIECELLAAMATATTSLFRIEGISRPARLIHLRDLVQEDRRLDLTDIAFSQSLSSGYVLFLRPIILSAFTMTSGFAFSFPESLEADLLRRWRSLGRDHRGVALSSKRYATFFKLSKRQGIETRYEDVR
jgi:hypothetical protein